MQNTIEPSANRELKSTEELGDCVGRWPLCPMRPQHWRVAAIDGKIGQCQLRLKTAFGLGETQLAGTVARMR
jgi:hypothetical protein